LTHSGTCLVETPGLGDDEIRFAALSPYAFTAFWPGFGATDVQALHFPGKYTSPVTIQLEELLSESFDGSRDGTDLDIRSLQSLPASEFERRNVVTEFYFNHTPSQGTYRLRYSLVHSLR
jgi:hypothetical protein